MFKGALVGVVVFLAVGIADAAIVLPSFSLDPASPAIDGNVTPDDVLSPGPAVFVQGSSLGLLDAFPLGDNLNALSYGQDRVGGPLLFSVDRLAVGSTGSDVHAQALPAEAQGDVYRALPPAGSNRLVIDQLALGLAAGFFGDDVDALELDSLPNPHVYFSIDQLSASNGFGALNFANDIFIDMFGSVFALGETHIGLDPFDDLDALVLNDTFQPGVLNPGIDRALFSLSTFSPSAFTFTGNPYLPGTPGSLSPADILFTDFTGNFSLFASAADIGLEAYDEVNALDTVVPEPGSFFMWSLLAVGLLGGWSVRFRNPLMNFSR